MHKPANRQPGASYAQRSPWHNKKVLGMHAQVVTKPSLATSGQLTIRIAHQVAPVFNVDFGQ